MCAHGKGREWHALTFLSPSAILMVRRGPMSNGVPVPGDHVGSTTEIVAVSVLRQRPHAALFYRRRIHLRMSWPSVYSTITYSPGRQRHLQPDLVEHRLILLLERIHRLLLLDNWLIIRLHRGINAFSTIRSSFFTSWMEAVLPGQTEEKLWLRICDAKLRGLAFDVNCCLPRHNRARPLVARSC